MNRIARNFAASVLGAWLLCMATLALADAAKPAERYTRVPAGVDGIGKRYMGRDIAGVMGWQGAAWLEREEREREERTDLLVKALQLSPGMVVADIGAGTGYLARRMSTLAERMVWPAWNGRLGSTSSATRARRERKMTSNPATT